MGRSANTACRKALSADGKTECTFGVRLTLNLSEELTVLTVSEDVQNIVFDADYLVLGLGDVYLGAPVATPVDPRHRMVTTKYNPARPWTPENAVGIGGAYLAYTVWRAPAVISLSDVQFRCGIR